MAWSGIHRGATEFLDTLHAANHLAADAVWDQRCQPKTPVPHTRKSQKEPSA